MIVTKLDKVVIPVERFDNGSDLPTGKILSGHVGQKRHDVEDGGAPFCFVVVVHSKHPASYEPRNILTGLHDPNCSYHETTTLSRHADVHAPAGSEAVLCQLNSLPGWKRFCNGPL